MSHAASQAVSRTAVAGAEFEARYTIGEVAERTGLSAHTLRWYERIGLLDRAARSHHGQRRFSDADLGWLAFLGNLRATGMPVAAMLRYTELVRSGNETRAERQQLLIEHREEVLARIRDLQANLLVLDYKIDLYGQDCQ